MKVWVTTVTYGYKDIINFKVLRISKKKPSEKYLSDVGFRYSKKYNAINRVDVSQRLIKD